VGFECRFNYHEKVDGEYNKDEIKNFSRKIGDPLEDVALERLAAAIMGQYARRDIWILSVEVFEISKKPVSFKETKGGIVLKNKKFMFDHNGDTSIVAVEEISPKQETQMTNLYGSPELVGMQSSDTVGGQQSLSAAAQHTNLIQHRPNRRPIDIVVFAPEPQQLFEAKKKGLKFTVDKKYQVFEKRMSPSGIGELYTLNDDLNREQRVSDIYFVPANVNLFADRELNFSESPKDRDGGTLLWGNASSEPGMPDLRGKR
jgi:hypothetical protein